MSPSPAKSGRFARCVFGATALLLAAAQPVAAQTDAPVYFDGSVGFEGSAHSIPDPDLMGVEYQIDYCPSCGVDTHPFGSQGELVGDSLFQSLRDINVPADDAARFAVSEVGVDVDYVFARITSGEETNFQGDLRSDLGADIYLLNPFGLVFGAGSQIDVNGTFYASTADALHFDGVGGALGQTFGTHAGGAIPTVAVGNPAAFGFLIDDEPPARILFDSDGGLLSTEPGRSLTAVAGRIEIDDEANPGAPARIFSNGGQIKLAAAPAGSRVPVDVESVDVNDLASDDAVVRMARDSRIEVRGAAPAGEDPARIVIRGGRFEMVQPSDTFTTAHLISRETGAGSAIDVEVAGTISLDGGQIQSVSDDDGSGGNIRLVAETIELLAGTDIDSRMRRNSTGVPGANILLDADNTIDVSGGSTIRSRFSESGSATGDVGDITLLASELTVSGAGSAISTTSRGSGSGATVHVEAGDVTLNDDARITTIRAPSGSNLDAGGIEILAENLSVSGGAEINSINSSNFVGASIQIGTADNRVTNLTITDGVIGSVTTAAGAGGNVEVHADSIVLNRTLATADVNPQISALTLRNDSGGGGDGPGGNLTIHAGSVQLDNGSQFRATTQGDAPGGNLTVVVDGLLAADGSFTPPPTPEDATPKPIPSGIFANSELSPTAKGTPTTGHGGNLDITAGNVTLTAGAELSARADSVGNGGNLSLVADTVLVEGDPETNATSTISVRVTDEVPGTEGPGGNLTITTHRLQAYDQGIASASTSGTRDAGTLTVTAGEIDIAGAGSGVFAQSNSGFVGAGRAGAISLAPPDGEQLTLRVRDGAKLSVESKQDAAGAIEITDAALVEVTNGGEISAFATTVDLRAGEQPADLASDIHIVNADSVRLDRGTINAQTNGDAVGGTIEIEARSVEMKDSTLTASTLSSGAGGAIEIDARNVRMDGGTMSAATADTGAGGRIALVNANDVLITGGAEVTSKSTADTNGGRAGTIAISANDSFQIDQGSRITTTTEDANGGGISIQAGELVYLLDAIVKSDINVKSGQPDAGAGNIFIPFDPDDPNAAPPPDFVVINRSTVSANASGTGADGGDITISGREVMISTDSVIEATASDPTGVSGNIQITAPDSDVVSQLTPLAASFVDASDRLLPPCIARTERTGSFIVQNRAATLPSPDSPLSAGLGTAAGAGGTSPSDSVECSVFEEKI